MSRKRPRKYPGPRQPRANMVIKFSNLETTLDRLLSGKLQEGLLSPFEKRVADLIFRWTDRNEYLEAKTSGSTGIPKIIKIDKAKIKYSAMATLRFIDPGKSFKSMLLCMDPAFIGGAMGAIRALIGKLDLTVVAPESNLARLLAHKEFDLVSLASVQARKLIAMDKHLLDRFNCAIIGGATLGRAETKAIESLKHVKCYHSYGMTETASHIALKNLSEKKAAFETLGDVQIARDDRGCLKLKGTISDFKWITTNDIVSLVNEHEFTWEGRADFVINSGGIKINPETVEQALADQIKTPFFIVGVPDERLGEKAVMVIEGASVPRLDFQGLPKYHRPKEIFLLPRFDYTGSGKIDRRSTTKKIRQ